MHDVSHFGWMCAIFRVFLHVCDMTDNTKAVKGTHLLITQQGTHMESKQQQRKENRKEEGINTTKQQFPVFSVFLP